MSHPDEDTLLKYVLEMLGASEAGEVKSHIETCASCRDLLDTLERQVGMMGRVTFPVMTPDVPLPSSFRRSTMSFVLRAAAILVVGFILGYVTAIISRPAVNVVVSQQFKPTVPEVSVSRYTPSEQVDLGSLRAL